MRFFTLPVLTYFYVRSAPVPEKTHFRLRLSEIVIGSKQKRGKKNQKRQKKASVFIFYYISPKLST